MECVSEEARCWQLENEADSLPYEVVAVNETIKEFCSTCGEVKRVGNYFVGQELGEGMFAKVKKGIHVLTGELVRFRGEWLLSLDSCSFYSTSSVSVTTGCHQDNGQKAQKRQRICVDASAQRGQATKAPQAPEHCPSI